MAVRDYDIILLALARWDGNYSSTAFSLAQELAQEHRVFYIDNPFTYTDFIRKPTASYFKNRRSAFFKKSENVKSIDTNLFAVCPKLMIPTNWLADGKLYKTLNRFNHRSLSKTINQLIKDYRINKFVFINSFNPFYSLKFNSTNPLLKIYHSVDNIEHASFIKKHGGKLEKQAVATSDLTIVTSTQLRNKLMQFSDNVHLIPNAANITLFAKAITEPYSKPIELRNTDNIVIGYIGNLDNRLDIDLIELIAENYSSSKILLVGPIEKASKKSYDNLKSYDNIIFTGKKAVEELPKYLKYMDCCIIPFKKNKLTASIYPLKINEYLAAGKPVVTTSFSIDLNNFSEVIRICDDSKSFCSNIEQAMMDDSQILSESRQKIAQQNDWSNRVKQLHTIINERIS